MSAELVEILLSIVVSVTVIIGYFNHSLEKSIMNVINPIIIPMKESMESFNRTIVKFETLIDKLDERQHQIDSQITLVDNKLDALHSRLDKYEKRCDKIDDRITVFANFCRCEHQGDMSMSIYDRIVNGRSSND
jgi:septation ring formation regulator EzrA